MQVFFLNYLNLDKYTVLHISLCFFLQWYLFICFVVYLKCRPFFAGRLQLPMEALCVSLSLFSNQIKKTDRWPWVACTFFQSQYSHACFQVIQSEWMKLFMCGETLDIWNGAEYCSSATNCINHAIIVIFTVLFLFCSP